MPDPRKGVFETLLVRDGRPVEWEAHMARLRASLAALYPGLTPPPLDAQAEGTEVLRITVAPDAAGDLVAEIERRPAPGELLSDSERNSTDIAVPLHSVTVPGGLGPHKWADRSLLDEAQAKLPDGALPLIVDEDETVLEASRANVFAIRDGVLATPPLDGRILPGIARRRVIEIAKSSGVAVRGESLSREDLLAADGVFLTGSVRGIERVASLDGASLSSSDLRAMPEFG